MKALAETIIEEPEEGDVLPKGWRLAKLSELIETLETGARPSGGAQGISSGVPSISAEHMKADGVFDFTKQRFIPRDFFVQMKRGRIRKGDILVVKDGATTGKCAFVDDDYPFEESAINEHVFIIRTKADAAVQRFVFYWLLSQEGQRQIRDSFQGSAIGGINQSFVDAVTIPLPPLSEQRRIAAKLCEKLEAVARAKHAARARADAIAVLAKSVIQSAFVKGTDGPRKRLAEIASLRPSASLASDGDTEVIAITTACLSEDGFQASGLKTGRMSQADADKCKVAAGEILVARSNTPELVGRASMFPGHSVQVVASDLTIRIWANRESVLPEYLSFYLSRLFLSGYWQDGSGGASGTMKKITRTQLLDVSVPTPSLADQVRISTSISERLQMVVQLRDSACAERGAIDTLSYALLRQAFSGGG
jgi:type I restriction enzyme S subunit